MWLYLRCRYPEYNKNNGLTLPKSAQKVLQDKKMYYFDAHFANTFKQKASPQQYCDIIYFEILSAANPIGSAKTWGKLSFTIYMKERI